MKRALFFFLLLLLNGNIIKAQNNKEIESYKLSLTYTESLSKKADFFYRTNNIEEAIRIIEEKLVIINEIKGQENLEYAYGQVELALYVANIGEYKRAVALSEDALSKIQREDSDKSVAYAIAADKLSLYYYLLEDYGKSLHYAQKVYEFYKDRNKADDNDNIISAKTLLANIYAKLSRLDEAFTIQKELLNYWKEKGDSLKYADTLHDISLTYAANGNYIKAITCIEESNALYKKLLGEDNISFINSFKSMADYYIEIGQYDKCIEKSDIQLELYAKYYGTNCVDYIEALSNQAFYYGKAGNYQKAIDIERKALTNLQKSGLTDSLLYGKILSGLARYNQELGFIDLAIEYGNQSVCLLQNHSHTIAYRSTLSILSSCYLLDGNYEKALELSNKVLGLMQGNKECAEYYGYLSNLANCYFLQGAYDDAIRIYDLVLQKQKLLLGEINVDYAMTLENLARCYAGINNYWEAVRTQERCIKNLNETIGDNNCKYALSILNLGYLFRCVGEDEKALKYQEEALNILENDCGIRYLDALEQIFWNYIYVDSEKALQIALIEKQILKKSNQKITKSHIRSLSNLVYAYIINGNYKGAQDIFNNEFETAEIKNYFDLDKEEYVNFLMRKAELFTALGQYKESIAIEKNALVLCEKSNFDFSTREPLIIKLLTNYYLLGELEDASELIKEEKVFENLKKEVYSNINLLPSKYRLSYWNKYMDLFTSILPGLSLATKDSIMISQTYDVSALFSKAILLREDLKNINLIRKSSDVQLQRTLNKYQENLALLNKGVLDARRADSLNIIIMNQEDEIKQQIKKYTVDSVQFTTWKDVQKKLQDDDIAIEFLSFKLDEEKKEGYIALTLKKDYNTPRFFPLCTLTEIDSVLQEKNRNQGLYKLIWEPIKEELDNVKNIYFSPSGVLYNLGIEYLSDKGVYIFDNFDLYRLSSTQELLGFEQRKEYKHAVLYGGLDYNAHPEEVCPDTIIVPKLEHPTIIRGEYREMLKNRGNFDNLPGSALEVKELLHIIRNSNVDCKEYQGTYGTEESFKKLSSPIDVLHLATHGLYLGKEEKERAKKNNYNFILPDNKEHFLAEDVSLTRSFLVMSGGNMLPSRYNIPQGREDGILTAQEISRLDFEGLDIVVLSACQSALGDISNEGVIGLQRGFKKAGAQTILMSIDKVDDEATRILMVEFYRNLMSGKTKLQSLKDAQKYLRQVDNGKYDNPKYWASFIMLDGLN